MIIGVVGSRSITELDLSKYLPVEGISGIVSGGAVGIDTLAREYAIANNIPITEILPEYEKYGRASPLKRNDIIIQNSDIVYIFYDGKSRGSGYVIRKCQEVGKKYIVYTFKE